MHECEWSTAIAQNISGPHGDVKIVTGPSRYQQDCAYGIKQSFHFLLGDLRGLTTSK